MLGTGSLLFCLFGIFIGEESQLSSVWSWRMIDATRFLSKSDGVAWLLLGAMSALDGQGNYPAPNG